MSSDHEITDAEDAPSPDSTCTSGQERAITNLRSLLEELEDSPDGGEEEDVNYEDLKNIIHKIDTDPEHLDLNQYKSLAVDSELAYNMRVAANERILEMTVEKILRIIKRTVPRDPYAARLLAPFTGANSEEEGKNLVDAVIREVDCLGEIDEPYQFKEHAEPSIIDVLMRWKKKETRKALVKFLGDHMEIHTEHH